MASDRKKLPPFQTLSRPVRDRTPPPTPEDAARLRNIRERQRQHDLLTAWVQKRATLGSITYSAEQFAYVSFRKAWMAEHPIDPRLAA